LQQQISSNCGRPTLSVAVFLLLQHAPAVAQWMALPEKFDVGARGGAAAYTYHFPSHQRQPGPHDISH
jgi:hypothetical protein